MNDEPLTEKETDVNLNPSLMLGLALDFCAKKYGEDFQRGDRDVFELRIYPPGDGSGCFWTGSKTAARWYYIAEQGAAHFRQADVDEVRAAVDAGGTWQATGWRHRPLATWGGVAEMMADVKKSPAGDL